jgi:hypothetical protein
MFTRNSLSLKALSVAAVFLLAGFLMPGFSFGSIGGLQISKPVTQNFEAHRFDSDYQYYALMNGGIPYAVVGLQKEYGIPDPLWKKINTDSAQLPQLIDSVHFFPVNGSVVFGAFILDSQGKRIGTFYSSLAAGVTVNNQNKTVSISTETSWLGD